MDLVLQIPFVVFIVFQGLQPAQCQCHSTALLLRMKNGNITLDHGRSGTCKWRLRPPGQNTMLLLIRQRKLPDQATQDDDSCSYRMTIDGNRPACGVSCFAYFEHGPCNASYAFSNRTCDWNPPGSRVTIKRKPVGMAQESDVGESRWIEYRYINCGPQAEEPLKLENPPWLKYVIITCSIVAVLCCMVLLAYFRKNQKSAPESQKQRPPSELYNDTVVSHENGALQSPPTLGAQAPQIPLSEDVSVAVHHTYVNVSVRTRIYEEIVDANRRNTYLKPIPVPKSHYDAWG